VVLISVLGLVLKETGLLTGFIDELGKILPGSAVIASIPALFGFLSMPGGALMSAPFIEGEADRLGLSPEGKTFYNVWFRHLLYWINPITSSTLLATTLSGFTVSEWLGVQSPLFLVMVFIGVLFGRGYITRTRGSPGRKEIELKRLRGVFPIVLTVALTLLRVPVWLSLLTGILSAFALGGVEARKAFRLFKTGLNWELALTVFSMLYLRDVIETTDSMAVFLGSVIEAGIPWLLVIIILPLLVGSISGSPAMGVGVSFPILLPLLGPPNIHLVSVIFLGITCAYISSPLHLCLVLSNNYFKSDLRSVIRRLAPRGNALNPLGREIEHPKQV